jgi:hypothetical protein
MYVLLLLLLLCGRGGNQKFPKISRKHTFNQKHLKSGAKSRSLDLSE